ncbi:SDR family NAD(P)-dependent oxidoreductase [Umezawaea tangerina]|uniref:NAD(P)-dependent dehydrogenase (Short-subunit alcohol dehydrogenase family) n=1 Tax=Umezawaea tangerina TaxID=84725 RepID=A0A2T0T4F5_9PSEU|nr:SDR family NAD(P)-dependent oxidoreductase [Umezawaea tangerina]PRY40558.1 NAD(P)-dependent dehydrogenase (short-subunit alcohol dehydrogenase family) [Umezawaea tangerina]
MGNERKTVVISGGTDGMGRALALARLDRGDKVVSIGSSQEKGAVLLAEAARLGAADRVTFLRADLSSIAENARVVAEIAREHTAVDALVLCANRVNPKRVLTEDGLESTFALYYLSRYLLGHGLRALFDASAAPVVVNIAAPGVTMGAVDFDDLQTERGYGAVRAQARSGRANDLLGVAFAEQASSRARYVLYHPGFTASLGGIAHLGQPVKGIITLLAKVAARPVAEAVRPVVGMIDAPPSAPLTADDRGKLVDLGLRTFDPEAARRLARVTRRIVVARVGESPLLPVNATA